MQMLDTVATGTGIQLSDGTKTALSGFGQQVFTSFETFIPYALGMAVVAFLIYLICKMIKKGSHGRA
jgi:threonine/homoserine/homoserine lactone efflux protein